MGRSFIIPDNFCKISLFNEDLTLLPYKAIYFDRHKTLIVTDISLGNAIHHKNHDITVPGGYAEADLIVLDKIIRLFEINDLFILGDMFNKKINYDVRLFSAWREYHHSLDITLVKGNYDILSDEIYTHFDIRLHRKYFLWNRFLLTHKPMDENILMKGCDYIFSGDVNPGVILNSKVKKSQPMPCFYFNDNQCILPAFGGGNGKYLVKPDGRNRIFVITKSEKMDFVLKLENY